MNQPYLSARFAVDLGIAGATDPERDTRIEADRVTVGFRAPLTAQKAQAAIEDLPLFGGQRQGSFEYGTKA